MSSEAAIKALRTAKWASTMTKWRIAFVIGARRLGSRSVKPVRRWQLVGFPGPAGRESAGIVDLMAIRKDHSNTYKSFKRGDLFEIILIQVKGGRARRPTGNDVSRLCAVAQRYGARVVLAEWKRERKHTFSVLQVRDGRPDRECPWKETDPGEIFR